MISAPEPSSPLLWRTVQAKMSQLDRLVTLHWPEASVNETLHYQQSLQLDLEPNCNISWYPCDEVLCAANSDFQCSSSSNTRSVVASTSTEWFSGVTCSFIVVFGEISGNQFWGPTRARASWMNVLILDVLEKYWFWVGYPPPQELMAKSKLTKLQ